VGSPPDPRGHGSTGKRSGHLQTNVRSAAPVAAASYTLIGAIVLLGALGYFADGWLGTEPWLLIGGLLLGIVVGFYELARVVWRRTR
jgi:ATP synthase protein I